MQMLDQYIVPPAGRHEVALHGRGGRADSLLDVQCMKRGPERLGEPGLDELVDHFEVARIEHDA